MRRSEKAGYPFFIQASRNQRSDGQLIYAWYKSFLSCDHRNFSLMPTSLVVNLTTALYCDWLSCMVRTKEETKCSVNKIMLSVVIINSSVLSKLQILNGFYFNRRSELQKKARKGGSKTQLSEKNHH